MRSVIIHGHYYQPPRENPWLEQVEAEASAAPYHDWNERIERECYRAVVAARVQAADGRIAGIVNALAWTSFNFGPTLLDWLEREAVGTYHAILAADRLSRARWGHGNALAQPYHHVILPLASRRDKQTEVRWGVLDFRRRFGRDPAGIWLPETAVDEETLEVVAAEGLHFTILAPHQVKALPPAGLPGRWRGGSGRELVIFPYNGPISAGVAFGPLTCDAQAWAGRLLGDGDEDDAQADSLTVVATDGETYGHHHRFGEMALAKVIDELGKAEGARLENFASFLARKPEIAAVEVVPDTSWSCAHGIERWQADCGCRMAPESHLTQRWRAPLRRALVFLAGELHGFYERTAAPLLGDVWEARDAYGAVVGGDGDGIEGHVAARLPAAAGADELVRAREALELERDLLRLFTSCAWFFDDISGLEPLQVLRYAARAVDLAGAEGARVEPAFLALLAEARSDDPSIGSARDVYLDQAKRFFVPAVKAAAGWAAARHVSPAPSPPRVGLYEVEQHFRFAA